MFQIRDFFFGRMEEAKDLAKSVEPAENTSDEASGVEVSVKSYKGM